MHSALPLSLQAKAAFDARRKNRLEWPKTQARASLETRTDKACSRGGGRGGRRTDGGTHARKVGGWRGGRRRVESPFGDQRGSGRRARAELSATV